jgi:hypothetical protein
MAKYDAIIVPGGGLRDGGELPEYVKRRFDRALARESGESIVPLSAWTMHRASLVDAAGRPVLESQAGSDYLKARGIPAQRIFCESTSYDTIGNGYFSRVQIVEPMRWRKLLIITSEFHMPRTEAIFRWIYSLDAPAPYELNFDATPDDGLSYGAVVARRAREAESLRGVERLRDRLTSLAAFAQWLFTEHDAYNAKRRAPGGTQEDQLLASY